MQFNLADLFECVVDTVPEREALVAGDVRRSYAALDERANRLAHHLAGQGVQAGDHVGILAWNRAEWIEAMLAVYKLRASPINVNYRYVEEELLYIFDNADLVALVHERQFAPRVRAVHGKTPQLRHCVVLEDGSEAELGDLPAVGYEAALAAASPERGFGPRSADDHYVLYTGGTTGMPKGTIWRSEDIFFAALGGGNIAGPPIEKAEELAEKVQGPVVTYMVTAPMMHGGGQWVAFIALFGGGKIVLWDGHHFDAAAVWKLAARERVQSVSIIGDAMGRPLADALAEQDYDLSSLVAVGSGGAILSKAVKEELRARLPGILILDNYGASETGHAGSVNDMAGPAAGPRFTMNERTAVIDDDGRPIAPGSETVGRLAHRGHIPLGYYKDEAKTRATFLEVEGTRWVVPGDFATVNEDGSIQLLGRGSVCINSGGEKIFPEEVEAALKSHDEVFDAVVVGIPDERFGQRVAAVVQARPGREPDLESLAAHCRSKIAGYKVPRALRLVDEIPRTPVGKPDYRRAAEVAAGG